MRRHPLFWISLSVVLFIASYVTWRLGKERLASQVPPAPTNSVSNLNSNPNPNLNRNPTPSTPKPLSEATPKGQAEAAAQRSASLTNRLTNTKLSLAQLVRSDTGIVLVNALLDTAAPLDLPIPEHLRASGDPGAFIIQSRGPTTDAFRSRLAAVGAITVSYIPNNAYLVRASQAVANSLRGDPQVQAILPYEPYYKLNPVLLRLAINYAPMPEGSQLNLLLFSDMREGTIEAIKKLGAEVLGEERSPFGTTIRVRPMVDSLPVLSSLPGVQEIELARPRTSANDLGRERAGAAADSVTPTDYLGLTGSNVLVVVADTGVSTNHPDLEGRVSVDTADSGNDTDGHGTHAAATIAGSGAESTTVPYAQGSSNAPVAGQFRGVASGARILSIKRNDDQYLQETAARSNALICNASFTFGANDYDLHAAAYDWAVRDSLPEQPGSQQILYVVPAGNGGRMNAWDGGNRDAGDGGNPGGIQSPGTAKNVITVGACEQPRVITNLVTPVCPIGNTCNPSAQWAPSTDSSIQVAGFSGRGNACIGIEDDFGRFKPDVVAPGTAVLSARSTTWDTNAYYNPTNYEGYSVPGAVLQTNAPYSDDFYVPLNAIAVKISVTANAESPSPLPDMPIEVSTNGVDFFVASSNNVATFPSGPGAVSPTDQYWSYKVDDGANVAVSVDITISITVTNEHGDFLQVLQRLNDSVGPWYRYESGTSMATANASGTLALMEEFFHQRLGRTNVSPALLKAMLINGARSLSPQYDMMVSNPINYQGWGVINLPNSLPGSLSNSASATSGPMFVFEQDSTNALATGQSHTRNISLSSSAAAQPLRITLVWTDPPGNPVAGVKLVNDLDLVVTNTDTGDVFLGNDIPLGFIFNIPWDTNFPPHIDVINNVENVFIPPYMGTNFSVTVLGKRVNVNAVTAHTNNVVQDYALVISTGDGDTTNTLSLTAATLTVSTVNVPLVTTMTNMYAGATNVAGGVLLGQHVGANSPLLGTNTLSVSNSLTLTTPVAGQLTVGMTNQWHFYLVNNTDSRFTYAAFLTFLPPTLSVPRLGAFAGDANASRAEADIDLYVSTDSGLTNLDRTALAGAWKSLSRGGSETIILSNATATTYYVGVKCESQEGAEYGFASIFSPTPFGVSDVFGNQLLQGFPMDVPIPDGTPERPQAVRIFAISPIPILIHRVVATNVITYNNAGDLQGVLSHDGINVYLNNHTPESSVTNRVYVYDDSSEDPQAFVIPGPGGLPLVRHSDGPGSLMDYLGTLSGGQWMYTLVNSSPGDFGTNLNFTLFIERQIDFTGTNGIVATLPPGACRKDVIVVPPQATNLTLTAGLVTGTGPVTVTLCPPDNVGCKTITLGSGTNTITFDKYTSPPLNAGTYTVTTCNVGNSGDATVFLHATIGYNPGTGLEVPYRSIGTTPILDDAVTYSYINVTNAQKLAGLEVGVRIDHQRESDLALTLIAPDGTRNLLCENRGGTDTNGMGANLISTNIVPVSSSGDWHPSTNTIDTGLTSGSINLSWDMYTLPDRMTVYYNTNRLLDTGYISGKGVTNLNFGPGSSTIVTIIMNEGNTNQSTTKWDYTVTSTIADYLYFTFTEDTNKTITPVKFAPPPFVPTNAPGLLFSDFETNAVGPYTNSVDGWTVTSGPVVVTNSPPANSGTNSLMLQNGQITRTLPTVPGHDYTLRFAYRSGPFLDGLISWWKGEGDAHDSVGTNNGTLKNGASFGSGEVGQAFSLNGTTQYVSMIDSPSLRPADLTVEGWFNFSAVGGIRTLFAKAISAQNLVTNGSFEIGTDPSPYPGHTLQLSAGDSTSITGWTVQSGTVDYIGLRWTLVDGVRCVDLSGVSAGTLVQSVSGLMVGQTYRLSFLMAGNPEAPPTVKSLVASIGAASQTFTFDGTGYSGSNMGWSRRTMDFTATSTTMTLSFRSLQNGNSGPILDGVSIGPVNGDSYSVWYDSGAGQLCGFVSDTMTVDPVLTYNWVPVLGTWHHIALTFDSASLTKVLYVDGTAVTNGQDFGPVSYGNGPFQIGADIVTGVPSSFFGGWSDEVSLFGRALSPTDIAAIFAVGGAGKCGLPAPPPVGCGIASAKVVLNGQTVQTFTPTNTFWVTNTIPFTATSSNTTLALAPVIPGGSTFAMVDTFTLNDNGSPYYVLPEEPMAKLLNKNAQGTWTLEILDDRVGATNPAPTLLHWELDLAFQDANPLPEPLQHGELVTNTIAPGQIDYYTVTVPNWPTFASNWLVSASAPVNLWFNQQKAPAGTEGDFLLLTNQTSGVAVLSLTNSSTTWPPLLRDQTYYLGIQNAGSNSLTYVFQVDFDVTPLFLNLPFSGTNDDATPRYFSYLVTANETAVSFDLTNLSGNADLYASYGMPFPTTALGGYAYHSINPGVDPEQIIVFTNSTPVPLAPGQWYLGLFNNAGGPVRYTILVTDYTNPLPRIIPLTNGIPYSNANPGPANSGNDLDYYSFSVDSFAVRAQFELNNPSGAMFLVAHRGLPLPDRTTNPYATLSGANDALISVFDYSSPPLQPGLWFLTAINDTGGNVNYSIKASDWSVYGTPILITGVTVATNQLSFTWNYLSGVHYFVEGKTDLLNTNWTTYLPWVTAPTGLPWTLPLPSTNSFFRVRQQQ